MDENSLNERLQYLNAGLLDAKQRIEQAKADANAFSGAIQEIEYWLKKMDTGA